MGHYLSTLTNRKWKKAPMRGPFYLYLSYDWQVPIPWQLLKREGDYGDHGQK